MPGNYPEESIQHSEHGESLKSRSFTTLSLLHTNITVYRLETDASHQILKR